MEGRPTLPPKSEDCSTGLAGLVVEWALCCCPGKPEGWIVSGSGPCDGWPANTGMTPHQVEALVMTLSVTSTS